MSSSAKISAIGDKGDGGRGGNRINLRAVEWGEGGHKARDKGGTKGEGGPPPPPTPYGYTAD